ncbi:MAG: DUF5103 domain-containing protein [Bacteroidales bacterium]|nr:DUF5103 domain-containing protein [Bacteroidales bacterium]MBN2697331.1 DUF5103 domain-containing protein [Bacteroidales bacterium]
MKKMIILSALVLSGTVGLKGQAVYLDERGCGRELILDADIKSVQLYREGWPLSYPVTRKENDIPLVLEFDELLDHPSQFNYKIVHCNADWTPSELSDQEVMEGFPENVIRDYRTSFSTYYNYTHYTLQFPNEELRFKISGNYLLIVYRDYDESSVVLTRRFMITEGIVSIEGKAKIPELNMYRGCCQEIDFTVNHSNFPISDPYSEPKVFIYQNGIWDLNISGLRPLIVNEGELVYDYQQENIFMGGNEFRLFDTKNTRIPTYYVQSIDYISPYFHFTLKPDEPNKAHLYFSREDMNGRFFIESEEGSDPDVDADYVFVHFRLNMAFPPGQGSVYIAGALTNWQFGDENRMEYDADQEAYMKTLLLKQGVYNYRYVFIPESSSEIDISAIEGSHFETENEYLVLFYHFGPGERFDRLIGHQVVRSNAQ